MYLYCTYTKASNADGCDIVLGTSTKKVNGETRPVEYGTRVKKNIKGNVVTATFKNMRMAAALEAYNVDPANPDRPMKDENGGTISF